MFDARKRFYALESQSSEGLVGKSRTTLLSFEAVTTTLRAFLAKRACPADIFTAGTCVLIAAWV
jgi:hypothetical protein